jgi:hypothetical protein
MPTNRAKAERHSPSWRRPNRERYANLLAAAWIACSIIGGGLLALAAQYID